VILGYSEVVRLSTQIKGGVEESLDEISLALLLTHSCMVHKVDVAAVITVLGQEIRPLIFMCLPFELSSLNIENLS
jgi:hypothetical protein